VTDQEVADWAREAHWRWAAAARPMLAARAVHPPGNVAHQAKGCVAAMARHRVGRDAGDRGARGEASEKPRATETPSRQRDARQKSDEESGPRRSADEGGAKSSRRDRSANEDAKASEDRKSGASARARDDGAQPGAKDVTAKDARDKNDSGQNRAEDAPSTKERAVSKQGDPERAKHADLAGDKRDRVRNAFHDKGDAKRRTNVDIDISVGRRLPREWHFYPVPIAVIDIVPEYRDYVFVYVDDEYVICDPDTYEVVAVVPVGEEYAGGGRPISGLMSPDLGAQL
jgi:hypothetical protein